MPIKRTYLTRDQAKHLADRLTKKERELRMRIKVKEKPQRIQRYDDIVREWEQAEDNRVNDLRDACFASCLAIREAVLFAEPQEALRLLKEFEQS